MYKLQYVNSFISNGILQGWIPASAGMTEGFAVFAQARRRESNPSRSLYSWAHATRPYPVSAKNTKTQMCVSLFHPSTLPLLIATLIVFFLLTACASIKPDAQRKKLRTELQKWESFEGDGIVEISYMGLSLRKMFSISKNKSALRLDIYDGGIMGAGAKPLLSVYSGDYVAIESALSPMLDALIPLDAIPLESMNIFASADSVLVSYGEEIIKTRELKREKLLLQFNTDYRVESLTIPKSSTRIVAFYSTRGSLQEITLQGMENMAVKLIFDKISYVPPEIIPLPKKEAANPQEMLKVLENLDMKQLMKDYLKKQP
jgi:hypothetical protein